MLALRCSLLIQEFMKLQTEMRYNLPFKASSAVSTSILHPQEATEQHFAFHNPEPQKLTAETECLQKLRDEREAFPLRITALQDKGSAVTHSSTIFHQLCSHPYQKCNRTGANNCLLCWTRDPCFYWGPWPALFN